MRTPMENPATLVACGAPKSDLAGASITSDSISSNLDLQADALARQVFGRGFLVERASLGAGYRRRAPSRIRAWRAPA
jgi:hypothetical protein